MPRNYIQQDKIDSEFNFLNVKEENQKLYRELHAIVEQDNIQSESKALLPYGYELSKIKRQDDQFIVVLLDHNNGEVAYYIRVNIWKDIVLNSKPVTQVLLWRSIDVKHKDATRDLAEKVFFNYLINKYNVVASDSHQTVQGRTFWQTKLSIAISKDLFVYRYHRMLCTLQEIKSSDDVASDSCNLWGDDEDYQNVLAIISVNEINL